MRIFQLVVWHQLCLERDGEIEHGQAISDEIRGPILASRASHLPDLAVPFPEELVDVGFVDRLTVAHGRTAHAVFGALEPNIPRRTAAQRTRQDEMALRLTTTITMRRADESAALTQASILMIDSDLTLLPKVEALCSWGAPAGTRPDVPDEILITGARDIGAQVHAQIVDLYLELPRLLFGGS